MACEMLIITVFGLEGVPRTIGIIQPTLLFLCCCFTHFSSFFSCRKFFGFRNGGRDRLIIYGAGTSGRQLANALTNNNEMSVVGFIDDDVRLHGKFNGLPIYDPTDLDKLVSIQKINTVLLAMPM